jgi:sugar phosphate isomerase/epimerase
MKTSAGLFLTDILPHKRKVFHKIVKNNIFGDYSLTHVFQNLKKSGVDGIELLLPSFLKVTADDITEMKQMLDKHEIHVLSVHQSIRFFSKTKLKEINELFSIAHTLGAKVVVLHISLAGKQIFDKDYVAALHEMEKKYGIKIGFENREKVFGATEKMIHHWDEVAFPKLMRENDFFITLDTTHLAQAGGDIITFFKKNKDRIINIHLSDYKHHFLNSTLRPLRYKHMRLGHGELPIQAFLEELRKADYKGLVTMEIHTDLAGMIEGAKIINLIKKIEKG